MYSLTALRYADAVARLRSFSAAARECGVSQPTVSAAIAELETQLGAPLFVRGGRQLGVAAPGLRLLPKIADVLAAVQLLESQTREIASTARSELRIGFTPLVGAGRLALLLDPFRREHREMHLLFFEAGVADLDQRLESGQLDLIIGSGFRRVRSRKRLKLLRDPLMVCGVGGAPDASATAGLEAISQQRLLLTEDLCGLATATRALFERAELRVDAYPGRAMSYGALEDWVELGLGVALIPRFHVRNRARACTLVDAGGEAMHLEIEAVWKSSLAGGAPAATFLTFLHRVVPQLARGLAG
ncbi:MAG: LysR family transcriptional regulator [Roseateles asaccharophilus]|uniref:LysR family transcriptional regulator n=1 Tax=Roseateles asaccharophilus TaxID=582607 RepID=UPI00391CF403